MICTVPTMYLVLLVVLPWGYPSLLSHEMKTCKMMQTSSEKPLTPKPLARNGEGCKVSKAMQAEWEKKHPVLENLLSSVKDELLRKEGKEGREEAGREEWQIRKQETSKKLSQGNTNRPRTSHHQKPTVS